MSWAGYKAADDEPGGQAGDVVPRRLRHQGLFPGVWFRAQTAQCVPCPSLLIVGAYHYRYFGKGVWPVASISTNSTMRDARVDSRLASAIRYKILKRLCRSS